MNFKQPEFITQHFDKDIAIHGSLSINKTVTDIV